MKSLNMISVYRNLLTESIIVYNDAKGGVRGRAPRGLYDKDKKFIKEYILDILAVAVALSVSTLYIAHGDLTTYLATPMLSPTPVYSVRISPLWRFYSQMHRASLIYSAHSLCGWACHGRHSL